jgi:hypothetical protein
MIPERNGSRSLMEGMVRDSYNLTVITFPRDFVIGAQSFGSDTKRGLRLEVAVKKEKNWSRNTLSHMHVMHPSV